MVAGEDAWFSFPEVEGTRTQDRNMAAAGAGAAQQLDCWVQYDAETNFPIQNLPYGVFTITDAELDGRIGTGECY
jgi:hypothetical protein